MLHVHHRSVEPSELTAQKPLCSSCPPLPLLTFGPSRGSPAGRCLSWGWPRLNSDLSPFLLVPCARALCSWVAHFSLVLDNIPASGGSAGGLSAASLWLSLCWLPVTCWHQLGSPRKGIPLCAVVPRSLTSCTKFRAVLGYVDLGLARDAPQVPLLLLGAHPAWAGTGCHPGVGECGLDLVPSWVAGS